MSTDRPSFLKENPTCWERKAVLRACFHSCSSPGTTGLPGSLGSCHPRVPGPGAASLGAPGPEGGLGAGLLLALSPGAQVLPRSGNGVGGSWPWGQGPGQEWMGHPSFGRELRGMPCPVQGGWVAWAGCGILLGEGRWVQGGWWVLGRCPGPAVGLEPPEPAEAAGWLGLGADSEARRGLRGLWLVGRGLTFPPRKFQKSGRQGQRGAGRTGEGGGCRDRGRCPGEAEGQGHWCLGSGSWTGAVPRGSWAVRVP